MPCMDASAEYHYIKYDITASKYGFIVSTYDITESVTDANISHFNPIALRKAKIVYNFGLSECNRVKPMKPFVMQCGAMWP